jgi:AraC-like DNA-binding protein
MILQKYSPCTQLDKFVKCYYYLENNDNNIINDTFFADGCIEAVFSLGWNFYQKDNKEAWAKIIGQIIKPRELKIVGSGQSFGIWFYPHTFPRFSKVQMSELNDSVISWDVLFPKSFADFVADCLYERQFEKLVSGVDNFLLKKISGYKVQSMDTLAESAVQYLYQHKSSSDLDRLASWLNVSQRYLQKAFLAKIGFSQKLFIRMLRFQQILPQVRQPELSNLAALAYEHDFYDQSHFVREFKAFTGILPSQFEKIRLPISEHFIVSE